MSTLEWVQAQLAEKCDLERDQLQPGSELEALGVDSLSIIELMFNVEDEFKIKLPDERPEIRTIQDVVSFIDKLIVEQRSKVS